MVQVVWTEQSYEDLENNFDYISCDSERYAQFFIEKILNSVKRLEVFPKSGRIVPEVNKEYIRELIFSNYRIIYRIRGRYVEIITVHHGARILNLSNVNF